MKDEKASQPLVNQQILNVVQDIHQQNVEVIQKIDQLEKNVTKKAMLTGAFAGGLSGAIISTGIELIKMKLGG